MKQRAKNRKRQQKFPKKLSDFKKANNTTNKVQKELCAQLRPNRNPLITSGGD